MSDWTHVSGVIRFMDLHHESREIPLDLDSLIGKECSYNEWISVSEEEYWENPDAFMPAGSEGTLHKIILENQGDNRPMEYIITIFGDLRDSHPAFSLAHWFNQKCKAIENIDGILMRDAVVIAKNDFSGQVVYGAGGKYLGCISEERKAAV